ncbi:MAG TPA: acetylxylan esterase [Candidatus Dormibacteraeota bacterium]|nr:acetylxylan esterase [Candidatus Dormibacteraeota bacterium]
MSKTHLTRRDFLQSTSMLAGATLLGAPTGFVTQSVQPAKISGDGGVSTLLKLRLQTEDVVEFQIREYLMKRVPRLPNPNSAAEWTVEQKRLRKHLLEDVIFHGWPKEWVSAPPKFEDLGLIPSGKGYRLRRLRYEIVPGFATTALLYEPEKLSGKAPATINLNGHASNGKQADYKQKRCVNNALQGMYALSLEWLGMGELALPENNHWHGAHLNLVGASATGLFYLAIRRGLDYLCEHPGVDAQRIGATGLSGGAWQTITISALDERIAVAIPVAGYFSFTSAIERNSDVGDMEYHPHDLFIDGDYSTLTAMVAPRPVLLMYGAEDEYGLRAPLQKPHLYDEVRPFYKLYGKENNFAWHANVDPGTHNYELDNRQQSYAFFTKHFHMPVVEREVPVDAEVKTYEELVVGIPKDNLTIVGLAKKLAATNARAPIPTDVKSKSQWARLSRARLKSVVRYTPVATKHAWPLFSTRNGGVESLAYRLEFSNDLSATAVRLKATTTPPGAPITVLLDDSGLRSEESVRSHIQRGEQVLAVNLIFTGDASPDTPKNPVYVPALYRELLSTPAQLPKVVKWLETRPPSALYGLLLSAAGDRPLGMQAAQLIEIANWLRQGSSSQTIFLETVGIRNQVTGLVASALEPSHFSALSIREGMKSLAYLSDNVVRYQDAPDLFCLDLYKNFDIDILAALGEPTKITQQFREAQSS